mgnify:CR=1 FL=1
MTLPSTVFGVPRVGDADATSTQTPARSRAATSAQAATATTPAPGSAIPSSPAVQLCDARGLSVSEVSSLPAASFTVTFTGNGSTFWTVIAPEIPAIPARLALFGTQGK